MKKGIILILVLMLTVSLAFAGTSTQVQVKNVLTQTEKAAPIQYDPSNYPAPTRQGGDTVADATVIGALPYNDFGTTMGFVDDYDEVCPYTGSTSPDVVYSFTPAGDVTNGIITLCGDTDYDSKLYIYENAVTPGAPFACNDDECVSALGQSYVSELTDLTFTGGNTYYIVIDGYSGYSGNYEIDFTGDGSTTFDPPLDVVVDEVTGTVSWSAPVTPVYWLDDMDSYTAGEYLALQSDDWTTWSGTPGGADDGYVVDENSSSGSNSVKIEGASTDLVHEFGAFTSGVYEASMMMYIEPGYGGYYNLLHFFNGASSEWGMEVYFSSTGTGDFCATAQNITTFSHPVGSWFEVLCIIDLDADWAEYYVDGTFVYEWQWSIDTMGVPGSCVFGAIDIYASAATGSTPMFYCDDVMITEVTTRELLGFNIYLDGVLDGTVSADVTEYTYSDLLAGTSYIAGVSAVHDGGESEIIEVDFVYDPEPVLDPPVNLAVVSNPADDFATFTWEAPGGGGDIEELIYDNGTSTGAYSYVGYSMGTQMSPAEACQILTLKIHTSDGANFNAEVWGWDAGAPTEDLYYQENVDAVVDDWVMVDVSGENLMFDGDFVVTFGSIDANTFMSYDAGLNNGRSWDHADAGGWATWSEAYLVRAIVQYADGTLAELSPTIETNNNQAFVAGEKISIDVIDHNVDHLRELLGYNVYLDGVQEGNTTDLFWEFADLENGVEYIAGVEAVYDEGISDLVDITFLYEGTGAGDVIAAVTQLNGNYPNPFNPVTNIGYSIKETGNVTLEVYNLRGQLVKTLVNDVKETGDYTAIWDGTDISNKPVSSGVYFYKMKSGNYTATKKMILMK